MSNYKIKRQPPIKLQDLLRRRRATLKEFIRTSGIATYSTLLQKCEKMGVSPPSEDDFKQSLGNQVSSPQEGIVVLESPELIKDSGQKISVDEFLDHSHQEKEVKIEEQDAVQTQEEVKFSYKNKKNKKAPLETIDSNHYPDENLDG